MVYNVPDSDLVQRRNPTRSLLRNGSLDQDISGVHHKILVL